MIMTSTEELNEQLTADLNDWLGVRNKSVVDVKEDSAGRYYVIKIKNDIVYTEYLPNNLQGVIEPNETD